MLSGDDGPAEDLANQGPMVVPVTPNVSPIVRDENDPAFTKRRRISGPLRPGPLNPALGAPRGSLAAQSLDAELDTVGNAVSGLVAEASRSEEEDVEARYALADSKPKGADDADSRGQTRPSATAEPEARSDDKATPEARPDDSVEPPVAPPPKPPLVLPKVPASATFPDTAP
jgi:hypothetical protein